MISAICLFVVVALGWAYFGYIDIVAVAQGKFQPTGRVNVVQPVETGKVRAIHVSNGSVVKEGQVLVEMDPTDAQSDVTGQTALLSSLEAEVARRQAANETYRTRALDKPVPITWPANVSAEARQREQSGYDSDIAQLRAVRRFAVGPTHPEGSRTVPHHIHDRRAGTVRAHAERACRHA